MARLALWSELPFYEKDRISQLIQDITKDPAHGRALFGVLIAGKTPAQMAKQTGVALGTIHKQRRAFLNSFPIDGR